MLGEPETKILQLTPDMEFVVLASDGLWIKVNEIFMHEKIHVRFGIYLKNGKIWESFNILLCSHFLVSPTCAFSSIPLLGSSLRFQNILH